MSKIAQEYNEFRERIQDMLDTKLEDACLDRLENTVVDDGDQNETDK